MRRWRTGFAIAVTMQFATLSPGLAAPVAGHSFLQCLSDIAYNSDPTCAAHWNANTMLWHFGNELDDGHHLADRDSYKQAVAQWEGETNPNSPWNATKDLDATTHPNMEFRPAYDQTLGMGRILQEDASDHIPRVAELWVRHDVEELDCGSQPGSQACSWYNGTGTPGSLQLDQWGVWQEELGHVQNVSHHDPPTGHDTHTHQHTMSGIVAPGETTKRYPIQHENEHACYGYQVSHGYQCC